MYSHHLHCCGHFRTTAFHLCLNFIGDLLKKIWVLFHESDDHLNLRFRGTFHLALNHLLNKKFFDHIFIQLSIMPRNSLILHKNTSLSNITPSSYLETKHPSSKNQCALADVMQLLYVCTPALYSKISARVDSMSVL